MKKFITLIMVLLIPLILISNEKVIPVIEDFQLEGYENANFINVLLNPEDPISNFYTVTDDGTILRIENMSENPNVNEVFTYEGQIAEAITYDSTHYLALSDDSQCYLISTRDFISIDTLYQEINYKITDFNIRDSTIYMLMNNGENGKITYKGMDIVTWSEITTSDIKFNRLSVIDNFIYLYKYFKSDSLILKREISDDKWEELVLNKYDIDKISGFKVIDSLVFIFGSSIRPVNHAFIYNNFLKKIDVATGPINENNVILDLILHSNTNFDKGFIECFQVGYTLLNNEKTAYIHKFTFSGGGEDNIHLYDYSTSLNKIKSNERSRNMEFVAVGNDGIILIINRGATPVLEEDSPENEGKSFLVYPNLVKGNSTVYIKSNQIIDKIELIDLTGRKIFTKSGIAQFEHYLELQDLNNGMYFIKINGEVQKLLVE